MFFSHVFKTATQKQYTCSNKHMQPSKINKQASQSNSQVHEYQIQRESFQVAHKHQNIKKKTEVKVLLTSMETGK